MATIDTFTTATSLADGDWLPQFLDSTFAERKITWANVKLSIPDASASVRGLVSTGVQTIAGAKTFSGNVVVGSAGSATISCPGAGSNSERFGSAADSGTGANNVVIGASAVIASGGGASIVLIGQAATSASSNAVVIGRAAAGASNSLVCIGGSSSAANASVAIGHAAVAGANCVAIGDAATTGAHLRSIALGRAATVTGSNQCVIGSTSASINAVYIGSGITDTAPVSVTLNATGGSGTDVAGASLTLAGGRPTGSGAGGSIIFQTAAAGSSGTTLRSLVTRLTIDQAGRFQFGTSTSTVGILNLAHTGTLYARNAANSADLPIIRHGSFQGANEDNCVTISGGSTPKISFIATSVFNFSGGGNIGLNQASFGTSAASVFAIGNGTAPTTSPADCFQIWSADRGGTAGKAGLHLRSEDGTSHVFSDLVGLGTTSPSSARLHALYDVGAPATAYGGLFDVNSTGVYSTGTANIYGVYGDASATGVSTGGTQNIHGGYFVAAGQNTGAGNSTAYGLYVAGATGADSNYSAVLLGGNVGVNEAAPDYKLDVNGTFGFTPGTSVTPVDNGDVVIEATNNTTLTFKLKGSDGTVRTGTLTLA